MGLPAMWSSAVVTVVGANLYEGTVIRLPVVGLVLMIIGSVGLVISTCFFVRSVRGVRVGSATHSTPSRSSHHEIDLSP